MFANRTAGQKTSFIFPAADAAGNPIASPSSATWALRDEKGDSIATGVAVLANDKSSATVSLTAAQMTSAAPAEGREIAVTFIDAAGDPVTVLGHFVVVQAVPLQPYQNSFVTYTEAMRLRLGFSKMIGWDANPSPEMRTNALQHAWHNLCKIKYRVGSERETKRKLSLGKELVSPKKLDDEFAALLPPSFIQALKRAQLLEANVLLGGDVVGDKRKQGIISETIGESSMFFQSRPYLDLPFSKDAFNELKAYIYFRTSVRRG